MTLRAIRALGTAVAVLLLGTAPAGALTSLGLVGDGPFASAVEIQFGDGAHFAWEVRYEQEGSLSGIDLLQILAAAVDGFDVDIQSFGDPANPGNLFVDGISFGEHSDVGFQGGEGFWHYWTKELYTEDWAFATLGAGLRAVVADTIDGWRYGSALPPGATAVPEPAIGALLLAGLAPLVRRIGRRAS
jgi:hypothetical protein